MFKLVCYYWLVFFFAINLVFLYLMTYNMFLFLFYEIRCLTIQYNGSTVHSISLAVSVVVLAFSVLLQ